VARSGGTGSNLLAGVVLMLPGALTCTDLGYAGREAGAGGEGLIQKGLIAHARIARRGCADVHLLPGGLTA
jgi:hypothetical protein